MNTHLARIEALKILQHQRSEKSPFQCELSFHTWADKVVPLLSFDIKLQAAFKHRVASASLSGRLGSDLDSLGSINECIGIVNQAIVQLEHDGYKNVAQLAPEILPQLPPANQSEPKITLVWVLKNMSLTAYGSLFALLGGSFLVGQWSQEMRTASQTKSLAENALTTTNPTNLKTPSINANTASSPILPSKK